MKIFLTGASGYIGGSIAKKLIKNGHSVLGLVRSQEKAGQLEKLGVEPIPGSLRFALASNSRVQAVNARRLLGWRPSGPSLLQAIENSL